MRSVLALPPLRPLVILAPSSRSTEPARLIGVPARDSLSNPREPFLTAEDEDRHRGRLAADKKASIKALYLCADFGRLAISSAK
jgi:hypothetical protein